MIKTSRFAHALGWYSLALGTTELLASQPLADALGVPDRTRWVRIFGARELAHAALVFTHPTVGVWSRVLGDVMDLAALAAALKPENPARARVEAALGIVAVTTVIDTLCALQLTRVGGRASVSE